MPRKRVFSKKNSEKFLLIRGNEQAVNADGETLKNVLVPVSRNYKPGTSLLFSNIAALANLAQDENSEHKDLEGVFDDASTIEDSDVAENIVKNLLSDPKKVKFLNVEEFEEEEDVLEDDYSDDDYEEEIRDCGQDGTIRDQNGSENWKMFNEKFNKVMEEYDDDQIGSLDDDEDICAMQMAYCEQFPYEKENPSKQLEVVLEDYDEDLKEKILNYVEEDTDEEEIIEIVTEKPLEYDCESILSTYSNIYNHPTVVKEQKTRRVRNASQSSQAESEVESLSKLLSNTCNLRKKDETPEERKERQRKFKEAKKLRRELKKQTKDAFKEEKKSQLKRSQQNGMVLL